MTAKIEQVQIADLIPYARNSRTHSDAQVAQIAASIKEFGWTNPVLIDAGGGIIAGHGRVLAARKLGMTDVPCIRLDHLTDTQRRAYVIADNKLALNSGWDDEMLSLELGDLHSEAFDMALLGFDAGELSGAMGLDEELDGEAPKIDEGIDYKEKFAIIVDCADEAEQQATFERLDSMGFTCKVLVN
jgi:ParB-like chromosome segregation protein Spo0J